MRSVALGELETKVMDIVWQSKHCTVRRVLEKLKKDRSIAYTTVATVLQRLFVKGLVQRVADKNGYRYAPSTTKRQFVHNLTRSFIETSLKSFGNMALTSFAESVEELPHHKKEQLLNLIAQYGKNK